MTKTNTQIQNIIDSEISKSKKMIQLYIDHELDIKTIASLLNVRYNFVYNVVSNYCRINDIELRTTKKESKKDLIIDLINQGLTNNEISSQTKCCYNYVFNVRKQYELSK